MAIDEWAQYSNGVGREINSGKVIIEKCQFSLGLDYWANEEKWIDLQEWKRQNNIGTEW